MHGCLRYAESNLIFSHRDYTSAREDNLKLFASLQRDLSDSPFIFIGFSFEDDDFQNLWQSVLKYSGSPKRKALTFLITPEATPSLIESMAIEGITVIKYGVEEFASWLKANLPKRAPSASSQVKDRVAYLQKMIQSDYCKTIDDSTLDAIRLNFDIIKRLPKSDSDLSTSRFFLGAYPSWKDVTLGLPITRDIEGDLIEDIRRWLNKTPFRAMLIYGGAGFGKSTFIMQIAYIIHHSIPNIEVLIKKQDGDLNIYSLMEYTKEICIPVLIVVDDAYRWTSALKTSIRIRENALPIYVLAASRPSDWNLARKSDGFDIRNRIEIPRLSKGESLELAKAVKRFGRLKSEFESLSLDQLSEHFLKKVKCTFWLAS